METTRASVLIYAAVLTFMVEQTSGGEVCIDPDEWWLFDGDIPQSVWNINCMSWRAYSAKFNHTSAYELWLNTTSLVDTSLDDAGKACHTFINSTDDASCYVGEDDLQRCGVARCPDACPVDYQYVNERCYMLNEEYLNWTKARQICRQSATDAALVTIETPDEFQLMVETLQDEGVTERIWTGGHFTVEAWRWLNHQQVNLSWLPQYEEELAASPFFYKLAIDVPHHHHHLVTEYEDTLLQSLCKTAAWHTIPVYLLAQFDRVAGSGAAPEKLVGELDGGCVTIAPVSPSISFYGRTPVRFYRAVVEFNTSGLVTHPGIESDCTENRGLVIFTHRAEPRMKTHNCYPFCHPVGCSIERMGEVDSGGYVITRFACQCPDGHACMDIGITIPYAALQDTTSDSQLCQVKVMYEQLALRDAV